MGATNFRAELSADRGSLTRLKCYAALIGWSLPTERCRDDQDEESARDGWGLPQRRDLLYHAGVAPPTFSEHFASGRYPHLARWLGTERDGVDRCVLEAKQYSIIPWLTGWSRETKAQGTTGPLRIGSFIRAVLGWSLAYPVLARMNDGELPPAVRDLLVRAVVRDGDELDVVESALTTAHHHVLRTPGATVQTGLNRVLVDLRGAEGAEDEVRRRSRELATSIGRFMLLFEEMSESRDRVDHRLVQMLELALEDLTTPVHDPASRPSEGPR